MSSPNVPISSFYSIYWFYFDALVFKLKFFCVGMCGHFSSLIDASIFNFKSDLGIKFDGEYQR